MASNDPAGLVKSYNAIEPDAYTTATYNSAYIETTGFKHALVQVYIGTLGTSATLDVKIQESDSTNTNFTDVTGAAITQQTQAGTDASDSMVTGSVDLRHTKKYIRVVAVLGTATSDFGVGVTLLNPEHGVAAIERAIGGSEAPGTTALDFAA